MSNFVFLIIDAYNEEEKNDININSKIKFRGLIKENKKMWLAFSLLILSLICFTIFSFFKFKHSNLYAALSFVIYIIIFVILIPIFENSFQKNYMKNISKYNLKLDLLRKILKSNFKLYETKKVVELMKQCDIIIDNCKLSKDIFGPFKVFTKSIVFPVLTFFAGLAVKKVDISLKASIIITCIAVSILIMLLGIYYLLKNPVENYLDSISNKAKRIKGMLIDIYIQDFVKEKSA